MLHKFLTEIRGRFELTQSQAIGSLFLIGLILCFAAIPLLYRYVWIEPAVPKKERRLVEVSPNEEKPEIDNTVSAETESKKKSYQRKVHKVVPALEEGEEVSLVDATLSEKKKQLPRIHLNTVDTTVLKSVRGIGSTYAKRIVKYRERLGGFVDVDQLANVYNLPEEARDNLISRLDTIALKPYKFIDINNESFKELLSDLHFDYEDVKKIVNYRNQTLFYTKTDVYKTGLDSAKVKAVLPYIVIHN